ncbi:MAG TPA: hypothetical protein VI815_02450 [Candidatus Nanoarchaeia archaeon]|nr:hypothetical protein [Candidatus Nanoarchaeia archaeon]
MIDHWKILYRVKKDESYNKYFNLGLHSNIDIKTLEKIIIYCRNNINQYLRGLMFIYYIFSFDYINNIEKSIEVIKIKAKSKMKVEEYIDSSLATNTSTDIILNGEQFKILESKVKISKKLKTIDISDSDEF